MTAPSHPTLEQLADLRDGLLPPEQSRQVSDHTSGCADCTGALAALDEVSAALGVAGAHSPPVPAQVAASVDATLASLAHERASAVPSLARRRAHTSASPPNAASRRQYWPHIAAAAVACVVLGATGVAVLDPDGTNETSSASNAATDEGSGRESATTGDLGADTPRMSGESPNTAPYGTVLDLQSLTRSTLPGYARTLARIRTPPQLQDIDCQTAHQDAGRRAPASEVRWGGDPALVLLGPGPRKARVLTCESHPTQLFATSY